MFKQVSWKRILFRLTRPLPLLTILAGLLLLGGLYYIQSIDRIELYARHHSPIQFIKKLSNLVFIHRFVITDNLESYNLVVEAEDLEFLNKNLPETYQGNILTDEYEKTVNAAFFADDGTEYKVDVRYRGDTDNHWRDPKKSWQITFSKNNYFQGSREIDLIIPVDRYYLMEELSFYRARKLGLVVPETKFVNLFVNGKRQGVYWQVEEWSKDILEKHGFSGDTNLYGGRDFVDLIQSSGDVFDNLHAWRKYSQDPRSPVDNYADLQLLLDLVNNASDEEFAANIGSILDLEGFYRWLLIQQLMASNHQVGSNITGSNFRFFFDPTSGKFHFLPWDISVGQSPPAFSELWYGKIAERILSNPQLLQERNKMFWEYVGKESNLEEDLKYYDELDSLTNNDFYKDFRKVESNFRYRERVKELERQLIHNFAQLKQNLEQANAIVSVYQKPGSDITKITVSTESFSGVEISGIEIEPESCSGNLQIYGDTNHSGSLELSDDLLAIEDCNEGIYETVFSWQLPALRQKTQDNLLVPDYNETNIFIVSSQKVAGQIDEKTVDLTIRNLVTGEEVGDFTFRHAIDNQNFSLTSKTVPVEEFVLRQPIFTLTSDGIRLSRGVYTIINTVIIPKNTHLIIEPGTQIFMGETASILSYSPVTAIGTANEPIVIEGQGDSWGTFGIADAGSESTFNHIIIREGSEATVNGIFMSGMLSIFRSNGVIMNGSFSNAHGDDAVNIKYGNVSVSNSRFADNAFDGLDVDFSNSLIQKNTFVNNGNDGIDISGSQPRIVDNIIRNSADKCISVGEGSDAILFNNLLVHCGNFGIAIKDSSDPLIINNTITGSGIGISGYQKKQIFGGGKGRVVNSIVWANKKSVELNDLSSLKVESSVVEGGYAGDGNLDVNPELGANFTTDKDALNKFLNSAIYSELGDEFQAKREIGYSE